MATTHAMEKRNRQNKAPFQLLLLPAELRLQVYLHLFSATRLAYGERVMTRISPKYKRMKPAPNSLAILRSCLLINREIESSWISQVLFTFERVHDLLEKLSSVPRAVVERIRHIRVDANPLTSVRPLNYRNSVFVKLAWALKLIPGLCLDTLTIIGDDRPELTYAALDELVRFGDEWRELYYVTVDSKMLGFRRVQMFDQTIYGRQPQPSTWARVVAGRDGADSGASVTMYRATVPNAPGAVMNAHNRRAFEQELQPGESIESFGVGEERELMREGHARRELLVIVQRGKHATLAGNATVPYHKDDIRHTARVMTWPEVREMHHWGPLTIEDDGGVTEDRQMVECDSYDDINEYNITPLD
ncbi:hypothetical protein BJY00DRAFT_318871 [Aspergillus carlsbadensis]|nr:hypothetical protein BJY00DRAFT_318871 [Aspergillus carlsbadensis]